jgi:DNA-binding MarR family transcriptional regulator
MAIARLSRQLRQQAGSPLTPTLQSVLASIALHGPLSLGDLAVREQVAPPTITKLLGRLDDLGLIERQRGAGDRRVILVSLSPGGRQVFEESRQRRTTWLEQRLRQLDRFDPAQLTQAVELLEAIIGPRPAKPPVAAPPSPADPSQEVTAP